MSEFEWEFELNWNVRIVFDILLHRLVVKMVMYINVEIELFMNVWLIELFMNLWLVELFMNYLWLLELF